MFLIFLECVKMNSVGLKLNRPSGNIGYCSQNILFQQTQINSWCRSTSKRVYDPGYAPRLSSSYIGSSPCRLRYVCSRSCGIETS